MSAGDVFERSCRPSGGSGGTYGTPGKIGRAVDMARSTRRSASSTFPSLPIRMMLLYFPIISAASVSCTVSPSSFTHSKSRYSARSAPCCRTAISLPPARCLRSSMQNIGGCGGFSARSAVSWMRGAFTCAERYRR